MQPEIPAQFEPCNLNNDFVNLIGPLYRKTTDDGVIFGLRIETHHCNGMNIAHGGLLATLADVAISFAGSTSQGHSVPAVTVSLNTDFIAGAKLGSWIEARSNIGKIGGSLAFVSCDITSEEVLLLRASGVVKLLSQR